MDILIKPIITEKATTASELYNCYSFFVNRSRKAAYMKAGKKWEHIVEELSKRK